MDAFQKRWINCAKMLEDEDLLLDVYLSLHESYDQAARHYHSLTHVISCLDTLDQYPDSIEERLEIEIALWFHDAIYDVTRNDNEQQSADFCRRTLSAYSIDDSLITRICDLILATDHKSAVRDEAERIIVDVDMAILASPPSRYHEYVAQVRKEYSIFSDEQFNEGRTAFLKHCLQKESIFKTTYYRTAFEHKARVNIATELDMREVAR